MATTYPTLRLGSKGTSVKNLQVTINTWARQYNRQDFFAGAEDGAFGPQTAQAISNLQHALGLAPDGIVGPQTWDAIQKTGEAILSGQIVAFRPPRTAQTASRESLAPSQGTSPFAASAGFDISGLLGRLDWKIVGIALVLGIGAISFLTKGKR